MLTSPAVIWDLSLPAFSFSSFASHRLEPRRQGRLCAGLRVVTAWRPFLPPVTFSTLNDTLPESNATAPTLVRSCTVYLFWPLIFIVLRSFYFQCIS